MMIFNIGQNYSCEFSMNNATAAEGAEVIISCTWYPRKPTALSMEEYLEYYAARDRFVQKALGGIRGNIDGTTGSYQ